jgi:Mn2+/Fe2+ NRAMP family transporter
VVTGAADDDPSGIATYSIAGAQLGTGLLWTAWLTWPLMAAVQMMCARIGMVTGEGLADAPRPLAGSAASLLFTVGILGVGFLAIPTLSGSAGYAFAETFHWRQGLDQKLARARGFYFIVILSTAAGIAIDFADVNPIRVLVISAVVNGLLAPFLLVGILIVASDRKLMKGQPSSPLGRAAVGLTLILMGAAGIGMFLF